MALDEPGRPVIFTVTITDGSAGRVTLTSLVDDVHGDLDGKGTCVADGSGVIDPAGQYTCTFSANVTGNAGHLETDTITATAQDAEQHDATATDFGRGHDPLRRSQDPRRQDRHAGKPAGAGGTFTLA